MRDTGIQVGQVYENCPLHLSRRNKFLAQEKEWDRVESFYGDDGATYPDSVNAIRSELGLPNV